MLLFFSLIKFVLLNYNTKIYTISRLLWFSLTDIKQSLGQRCVMVGVVGNNSLLSFWHLFNINCQTFNSWRIVVGPTLALQLPTNSGFSVMAQHMLANCNRVIFLKIIFIFITGYAKIIELVSIHKEIWFYFTRIILILICLFKWICLFKTKILDFL